VSKKQINQGKNFAQKEHQLKPKVPSYGKRGEPTRMPTPCTLRKYEAENKGIWGGKRGGCNPRQKKARCPKKDQRQKYRRKKPAETETKKISSRKDHETALRAQKKKKITAEGVSPQKQKIWRGGSVDTKEAASCFQEGDARSKVAPREGCSVVEYSSKKKGGKEVDQKKLPGHRNPSEHRGNQEENPRAQKGHCS